MSRIDVYRHGLMVGWSDFRLFWSLRSWFFGWMLRILTNAFAWVLVGRMLGSREQQEYLLVGNAVAVGAAAALWASNAVGWSRYDGTHALMVIAPSSLAPAVLGRTSIWLLNGVATSLTAFVVLMLAFGYRPPLSGAFVPGLVVLVCASSFCFALVMGALVGRHTRFRNLVLDVSGTLLLALCGVSVPVAFWPAPVQVVAQLLPLTHGLAAIRALLAGNGASTVLGHAALEAVVGIGWLVLALLLMDRMAERGRRDGSIESF
ncbi:MAG: ABC transporter permease [Polyangiaceae bacterium]